MCLWKVRLSTAFGARLISSVVLNLLPPSVLLLDKEDFQAHLAQHRQEIIQAVDRLCKSPQSTTDADTQNALKSALAKNNYLVADVKRLTAERDDRDDRLADTMMRLLSLEKRLDRSKSLTLAKIEAQATHQRAVEESQEQEAVENGKTPSRPSSRVLSDRQHGLINRSLIGMQPNSRQRMPCKMPLLLL